MMPAGRAHPVETDGHGRRLRVDLIPAFRRPHNSRRYLLDWNCPLSQFKGREPDREIENKIDVNFGKINAIQSREFTEQIIPVTANIKEAIDIFYVVNASGVSLTDAELALAQISGYWPEARDTFKAKLAALENSGFIFKLDFIVYALLASHTTQCHSAPPRRRFTFKIALSSRSSYFVDRNGTK